MKQFLIVLMAAFLMLFVASCDSSTAVDEGDKGNVEAPDKGGDADGGDATDGGEKDGDGDATDGGEKDGGGDATDGGEETK